jgi:hypothetical protein
MNAKTGVLPVRILKIWFDVVLVLGALSAVALVGWLAISPFLMADGKNPSDAAIQVGVGERSFLPIMPLEIEPAPGTSRDLGIENASLVKARGELRLQTTDWWLQFASLGRFLVAMMVVLYVVWMLRRVLKNVLDDRPFDPANGGLLRRCGYSILLLGVALPPVDFVLASRVLSGIRVANLNLRPAVTFDKDVLLVGLLFLVFGIILTRGNEIQEHERALQEEQSLTV